MQFFIANNQGGYFWHTTEPLSRYQGWFCALGGKMIKIIDAIEGNNLTIDALPLTNTLVIEGYTASPLTLIFDIRESYDTPSGERTYRIDESQGIIWIRYNESFGLNRGPFIGMTYNGRYSFLGTWISRVYPFDAARNSPPSSLWVYQALRFHSSRVVIAAGLTKEEVLDQLFHAEPCSPRPYVKMHDPYEAAKRSLLSLRVYTPVAGLKGLYAGLPWFFQFWLRDSAIAYRALSFLKLQETQTLLTRSRGSIVKSMPAYEDLAGHASELPSADGALWLRLRLKEFGLKEQWQEYATMDFIQNNARETWMDTVERSGARIELQALKLAILKGTSFEQPFCHQARQHFLANGLLIDGIEPDGTNDDTMRPNIFLAAYLYPELLSVREWEASIDAHLKALWFDWGGLSSLSRHHPQFHAIHTGQVPASYHQGDSWFWINNLAAIAMHRINPKKYQRYVKKIFDASTNDILFYGIPGHASELSSASMFAPAGSPVQLWSAATYLELYRELHR